MSEDLNRIDPVTAERLLRRAGSDAPVDHEPVADLLAVAAVPARPGELTGEEAAVMAFRDAHLASAPKPRRRFMLKSVLVKASVVATVAVVGGGGVALAASTGHLPGTSSPADHAAARPTAGAHASGHASRPPAASNSTHRAAASRSAEPSGTPSPNLRGLCTAFRSRADDHPGRALDSPAFEVLVEKAGGKDKVASYCTTLLASPAGKASDRPSNGSTHATSHPTHPTTDPTRRSHPTPSASNTHIP